MLGQLPGRDGVKTALVEGMAAGEPLQTKPDTLRRPVDFDGLAHVHRAGRVIAAGGREKGGEEALVETQGGGQDPGDGAGAGGIGTGGRGDFWLHREKRRCTSARSSSNEHSSVLRRGLNTMDHCGFRFGSSRRTASRTRRRTRLRTTAFPSARGVVKPIRGCSAPGWAR